MNGELLTSKFLSSVAMFYINHRHGASLSVLTDHIGLTPPSMSKLIEGLVTRKLVSRRVCRGDRRKISLCLTPQGKDELNAVYACTQKFLMEKMSGLSGEDLKTIFRAMQILQSLFALDQEDPAHPTSREMRMEVLETKQLTDRFGAQQMGCSHLEISITSPRRFSSTFSFNNCTGINRARTD